MTYKKPFVEPGLINSSYVILFHVLILLTAPLIISAFPLELRSGALVVAIVFPLTLFWFSYYVRQLVEGTAVLKVILGAAFLIATLSVINAVHGPLAPGSVPIFYSEVPFFANLLLGLSGQPGLIYAGTVMAYGAYTYISGVALASLLENMYERFAVNLLPATWRRNLKKIDKRVDSSAVQASDQAFVHNQLWGIAICVVLLVVYAALYTWLIIVN